MKEGVRGSTIEILGVGIEWGRSLKLGDDRVVTSLSLKILLNSGFQSFENQPWDCFELRHPDKYWTDEGMESEELRQLFTKYRAT